MMTGDELDLTQMILDKGDPILYRVDFALLDLNSWKGEANVCGYSPGPEFEVRKEYEENVEREIVNEFSSS